MKKTFSLSIGGSLFHVEEDAYQKLDTYITELRTHFKDEESGKEILEDIEGRIAEKFSEKKSGIITLSDVDDVIGTMGTVDQFESEEYTETKDTSTPRKLFRDPDNAIIAGVSSGLGHFFGIDPIIFRLVFAVSVFLGGTGVIVYILLWVLVPEAKTSSQKLSMKGSAATISAMADMIKEKIGEVGTAEHKNALKKFLEDVVGFIRNIAGFVGGRLFPIIRVAIGIFITIVATGLALAATFTLIFSLFHISPNIIEGPFLDLAHTTTFKVLAASLYAVAMIPLVFIISFGGYLMTKRAMLSRVAIISLLGVWFIAIPVAGAVGTQLGIRAASIVENDPYYKRETTTETFQAFDSLVVTGRQSVRIMEGNDYSIETRARGEDRARMVFAEEDGKLAISETSPEKSTSCVFCGGEYVEITVTVPTLSQVSVKDSAHVSGDIKTDALSVLLDKRSSVNLNVKATTITVQGEGSSNANLRGSAATLALTLDDHSRFEGEELITESIVAKVVNSSQAFLYAKKQLDVTEINNSYVGYKGNPQVTKHLDASSNINNNDPQQ